MAVIRGSTSRYLISKIKKILREFSFNFKRLRKRYLLDKETMFDTIIEVIYEYDKERKS